MLWFGFACVGSTGPVAYAVLAQRFPPEMTGRVATALNGSMLALVFLLQNRIGLCSTCGRAPPPAAGIRRAIPGRWA